MPHFSFSWTLKVHFCAEWGLQEEEGISSRPVWRGGMIPEREKCCNVQFVLGKNANQSFNSIFRNIPGESDLHQKSWSAAWQGKNGFRQHCIHSCALFPIFFQDPWMMHCMFHIISHHSLQKSARGRVRGSLKSLEFIL